jgi:hypothetical protein
MPLPATRRSYASFIQLSGYRHHSHRAARLNASDNRQHIRRKAISFCVLDAPPDWPA